MTSQESFFHFLFKRTYQNLETTDIATSGLSKTSDDTLEESSSSSFSTSSESDVEDTLEMEEQIAGNPVDKNMFEVSCHNVRTTLRASSERCSNVVTADFFFPTGKSLKNMKVFE